MGLNKTRYRKFWATFLFPFCFMPYTWLLRQYSYRSAGQYIRLDAPQEEHLLRSSTPLYSDYIGLLPDRTPATQIP